MYCIAKLYEEVPCRDDFSLVLVKTEAEANDNDNNYIVVTSRGKLKVIIHHFKTDKKYDDIKQDLSIGLSKLLREYIASNNIQYGNFLFGTQFLTKFVSDRNKELRLSGSLTRFRKFSVAELYSNKPTPNQRIILAKKLKHSTNTQKNVYTSRQPN